MVLVLENSEKLSPKDFWRWHSRTACSNLSSRNSNRRIKTCFAVYSTFLQRAYDQILHDICIQNLPVVLGIDRAGIVGSDGETHQGIFDLSYLSSLPNMTIIAPKCLEEMGIMLRWALNQNSPVAIRYPRGGDIKSLEMTPIKIWKR